jgi:endonuclease YncB( thermonuclease family)
MEQRWKDLGRASTCGVVACLSVIVYLQLCCQVDVPEFDTDARWESGPDDVGVGPDPNVPIRLEPLPGDANPPWPPGRVRHGGIYHVEYMIDGDTAVLQTDRGTEHVRLAGIDTPACALGPNADGRFTCDVERPDLGGDGEFWGIEAWQLARQVTRGGVARIACRTNSDDECERGLHGRPIVWLIADGRDLSLELAAAGAAFAYTAYPAPNLADYCRAENRARTRSLGMWSKPASVERYLSPKTHNWYRNRDELCHLALRP